MTTPFKNSFLLIYRSSTGVKTTPVYEIIYSPYDLVDTLIISIRTTKKGFPFIKTKYIKLSDFIALLPARE